MRVVCFLLVVGGSVCQDEPYLTRDDFQRAAELEEEELRNPVIPSSNTSQAAWQDGQHFEGDIANMTTEIIREISGTCAGDEQCNALANPLALWPGGVVPYQLAPHTFSMANRAVIARAIASYSKHTCIRWVPKTNQHTSHYVYIMNDGGCYSSVGRAKNSYQSYQILSLGPYCRAEATVIHEMMHAIGFFHEQARADRNNYVTVIGQNIMPGKTSQFESYSLGYITHLGASYDYRSVMHYGPYAFGLYGNVRGYETIRTTDPTMQNVIGTARGLSAIDIFKINKLYNCGNGGIGTTAKPSTTAQPLPGPRAGCTNRATDAWCNDRAGRNRCWVDQVYQNCKKSCNLCNGEPKPTKPCENSARDEWCACHASQEQCGRHSWIRESCSKTCGQCAETAGPRTRPTLPQNCNNQASDIWCDDRSGRNWCWKPEVYAYCKKSCKMCNGEPAPPAPCKNKVQDAWCNAYATTMQCTRNAYVRDYCPKTCSVCRA